MKYIKCIIIIGVFILIFFFINHLLMPKYSETLREGSLTREYYKEDKNHEVIFLGDCEVYANFSPMVLYEKAGITSYVRGNSQQLINQSYYILKETLKYEIPKVVVFNVNSMRYGEDEKNEAYNRLLIDNMKWSKEKIDLINSSMTEGETFLSYVFPILRYHSRFSKLTSEDFKYFLKPKQNSFNGFLITKKIKPYTSLPPKKVLANYNFSDYSYEYLNKITELCQKNNIELILIKAPSLYPYWYNEYDNQIRQYALENNLDYYNLFEEKDVIGIDYQFDTYDGGLHLNLSGATKLSEYFAKILKDNYNLTDYRTDKKISSIYNEKLKEYNKLIKE